MGSLLVTGGAGFIGGNFVRRWAARHPDDAITVLDALTYAGNRANIAGVEQADLVVGNICDTELVEKLLRERGVNRIVHLAAESHVDRSIAGPHAFIETNIVGTYSLLEAARKVWLETGTGRPHRFHHISTDEVYGSLEAGEPAFTETTAYAPNSPYSASKASADMLVRAYSHTFGLEVTTSNCSNNYGPYQHPEKLIPLMLICALKGEPMPIYGDGANIRDWLHVRDHCRAIELCLEEGMPGERYNFGGGAERTNLEVVGSLCEAVDRAFEQVVGLAAHFPDAPPAKGGKAADLQTFVQDRPGHDRRYAIDNSKVSAELGFEPSCSFEDGLEQTVKWYLEGEAWWRPLVQT